MHLEVDLSRLGGRCPVESQPREEARGTPRFLHLGSWWGHTVTRDRRGGVSDGEVKDASIC